MALNPDRNLYSVGDVGPNVVIARAISLKGGLARANAVNLAAWLVIAAKIQPEELKAEIAAASEPLPPPVVSKVSRSMTGTPGAANQSINGMPSAPPPPVNVPIQAINGRPVNAPAPTVVKADAILPPAIAAQAAATMGPIDAEEKAAIEEGVKRAAEVLNGTPIVPATSEDLQRAWGV